MRTHLNGREVGMLTLLIVGILLAPSAQAIVFDNGLVNEINDASHFEVVVQDSPGGAHTTVNVTSTGVIGNTLSAYDLSIVNILGGSIGFDVVLYDEAMATIVNGTIANNLQVRGNAQVDIHGAFIGDDIQTDGPVVVNVYDVDIDAGDGITSRDATVNVYGGSFGVLVTELLNFDEAETNWYGGTLLDHMRVRGGVMNIYGTEFNHPFGPITDLTGTLIGTLSDGTPVNNAFIREQESAIINLVLVPEPSTMGLVMAGALVGMGRRRGDRASVPE